MSESKERISVTQAVLDHHLAALVLGVDEVMKDYDEESAVITQDKTFRGRSEITGLFKAFLEGVDPKFWPAFKITSTSTVGDIAYLTWEAKPWVTLATDTFYVKDGKIAVQTFTSLSV